MMMGQFKTHLRRYLDSINIKRENHWGSKSLLVREPNIVLSVLERVLGVTLSLTTLEHIRKACNIQRDDSEQNWTIFETKSFIICGFLCLFIAAISISCVVHASLSVPDWEDRSSSPQSSQPPSLPTHDMHIKSVRLSSYSSAQPRS